MKRTLQIADPCSERWEAMRGDGARRHCDACHKPVHDLSILTASEAERLLASAPPSGMCVLIEHDDDGTIHWKPGGAGVRAVMTLAVGASLMMAGCNPEGSATVLPAPEKARATAPLAPVAPPVAPTDSAAPLGQEADVVSPCDAGAKVRAAPAPPGKPLNRTIGCVCVKDDPLCSCL